ncbi:MAG: hypothetical protein JXQ84_09760 [Rhodospirillaceae bacterium]|nr:hypothetical protein [Rhodospirillaceae bacterium]
MMSNETYTVSLKPETAHCLQAVADAQGISLDDALVAALADYLSVWEEHLREIDEDECPLLPWLKNAAPGD